MEICESIICFSLIVTIYYNIEHVMVVNIQLSTRFDMTCVNDLTVN